MKVKNRTKYNAADLKKLFLACCRKVRTGKAIRKRLVVEVIDYKNRYSRANYYGSWAQINVGTSEYIEDKIEAVHRNLTIREIAWIACHEFLHSKGLHHRRMTARHRYFSKWSRTDENLEKMAWADSYQLRLKEVKPKVKKDLQLARYEKILSKVKEYVTKTKRVQNLLKKYRIKQRYYEKILIASGKMPKR